MIIISATEANRLPPEQWVNIYEFGIVGDAEFYDCCQVADLDLEDPSQYGLEVIEIMPVEKALLEPQPTDAVLGSADAAFQKWLSTAAVLGGTGESNK